MTRISTPFGFHSTAQAVIEGVDLSGKRAIVTGGAAGIGVETVRALINAGAQVTLAVRRPEAAQSIAAELGAQGRGTVEVRALDLADLDSVRAFTQDWSEPLHILVNNAGIMAVPERTLSAQGWEIQFATNFLGHFALVLGLHNALINANGARVVSLSSSANLLGPVVFDDINFDFRAYEAFAAYAQAKSACALLAVEISRRWAHQGVFANAVNPGAIATNLQKHTGGLKRRSNARRPCSKARRPRCCWRLRHCWKAWVVAISKIATRRWWSIDVRPTTPALHPMPSTRTTRNACGKPPCA